MNPLDERDRQRLGQQLGQVSLTTAGERPVMRPDSQPRRRAPFPAGSPQRKEEKQRMRNEFTAIYARDKEWIVAYCPEIPGANGQGRTREEAQQSLQEAVVLILEDHRADGLRGVAADAERAVLVVE